MLRDACNLDAKIPTVDSVFFKYGRPVPSLYDYGEALSHLQETKVSTLSNGLRVATEYVPYQETATVGVWIDAGSRYETDEDNGTAHFLEHMIFKGTQKRSQQVLEQEIENMGGHLNAYTSREQTCYYAKVLKEHVPTAMEIVSDILQNSKLEDRTITLEKDVILREMQEIEGNPEEVVFDHLHATAFQYSPLGRTILGTADNIRSMTRDRIMNYIKMHYTAGRMVLVATGSVDHDEIVKQAEKLFSGIPATTTPVTEMVAKTPAHFTGSEIRFRDPDMPKVYIAYSFRGASWKDPDSIPLMVMQTILGAWDKNGLTGTNNGSRLAQLVSCGPEHEPYVCDSFLAFNTNYHDSGLFGCYTVSDKNAALDDLGWCVMNEHVRMIYNVTEYDCNRAQNQLKSAILYASENTTGLAEEIARHLLVYGRRIPKTEMFARIDAVTPGAINAVADRFVYDNDIAIVAMGDTHTMPDYHRHRRWTYFLRY